MRSLLFCLTVLVLTPPSLLALNDSGAPLAAPGLRPPNTGIPWALDTHDRQTELIPIHHANITVNRHTGKNIAGSLAGSLFYRPEMTTELEGEHARAQLHTTSPILYFHVDEDDDHADDQGSGDKQVMELVPAKVEKNRRVVDNIRFNQLTTHGKHKVESIAVNIDKLPGGWFRLTPKSPLSEGEYVFLSQPVRGEQFATTVYPFGIDSKAAESTEAVHPDAENANPSEPH